MAEKTLVKEIREGMTVYEQSGNKIGEVKFVHNGAGIMADMPDIITLKEEIDDLLGCTTNLPTIHYQDMYRNGFVRVKRGFLRSDVIVIPSQILDLGADSVFLDVQLDELPEC